MTLAEQKGQKSDDEIASNKNSRISTVNNDDIAGKELEIDLSNFNLGGAPDKTKEIKMKTAEPRYEDEIDGDEILNAFDLDYRLIE